MSWSVKNGWHPPVGQFTRKADAQEMARQMRAANRQAGIEGAVKVVKTGTNSARRKNPTKAQRKAKARTSARKRGIAGAVKTLLKKVNPSARISGASLVKLKGGGLTIRPIKANRARRCK